MRSNAGISRCVASTRGAVTGRLSRLTTSKAVTTISTANGRTGGTKCRKQSARLAAWGPRQPLRLTRLFDTYRVRALPRHSAREPPNELQASAPCALRDLRLTNETADVADEPRAITLVSHERPSPTLGGAEPNGHCSLHARHPRPGLHTNGPHASAGPRHRWIPCTKLSATDRRAASQRESLLFSLVKSTFTTIHAR